MSVLEYNTPAMAHNTKEQEESNMNTGSYVAGETYFMNQYRIAQLLHNYQGTYEDYLLSLDF